MVDLDGTLVDTKDANYIAYKEAMLPFGFDIDYKYYCEFCNGRHYLEFLPKITTSDKNVLSAIHERKKELYSKYLDCVRVNQALVDILKNSGQEYKTALVTTASKQNTYELLQNFKLESLFDLILTREDVTKNKPDPEGYIRAMECFDAKPEECVIFEDSDVGIEAAQKTKATVFVVKGYN